MRIDELTPAQQVAIQPHIEKWTRIGLCTDPADRSRAEAAIPLLYRAGRLKPPQHIIWCGSPLSQGLVYALLNERDSVWASVWASVWVSLQDSARAVFRNDLIPFNRFNNLGFRLVLVLRPPSGLPADSGAAAQVLLCRPPLRVDTNRLVTR